MKVFMLGDGPYAREVASYIEIESRGGDEIFYISRGEDALGKGEIIAIGIANPRIKRRVIRSFYLDGTFLAVVHPYAFITASDIDLGCGVSVGPATSIGLDTTVADFVSICANVTIGHDCHIGKYSTICPGAVISGNVTIGKGTFIGAGAVIKNNVDIGQEVVVGCGAVVIRDIADNAVVAGNPAEFLRWNK